MQVLRQPPRFEDACAEGTLDCGGLTPPWDRHGTRVTQHPLLAFRVLLAGILSRLGATAVAAFGIASGSKAASSPSTDGHSWALRAFSSFPGACQRTGTSDCFERTTSERFGILDFTFWISA